MEGVAMGRVAIILAAGKGTRMKSDRAKVLHPVAGRPMLLHVLDRLEALRLEKICVVVGHQADEVRATLSGHDVCCVLQKEQLGTAHAVLQAREALKDFTGTVVILNGDTPLLTEETLRRLLAEHENKAAPLTFLTSLFFDPTGYGRIVRDGDGMPLRIVEEKDATPEERKIREINAGVYAAKAPFLFEAASRIGSDNRQKEYYLTDIVREAITANATVATVTAEPDEIMGINSRADLARAERLTRERINHHWMVEGVTMIDPATVRIDATVTLAPEVWLHPNVTLEGATTIGARSEIGTGRIKNSRIGPDVRIRDFCVIEESEIEAGAVIGPFAHLRPGSVIRKKARVGNFVEIKKSELGEDSRAGHLTYLGDTVVGRGVNIGAGTITCNFDGQKKHRTIIEDGVFVGSGTQIVAPVRIAAGAKIGAGSTLTQDVPPDTLALSRAPQTHRPKKPKKEEG
jgi:bifunctional UDP-N-acetylglucosamine pyrophosphorylase/glucosamine-1-phosphate N-acetyltransferase